MSSVTSLVHWRGNIVPGDGSQDEPDRRVLAVQAALYDAGYRVAQDGAFGPRTRMVVEQFQQQHGLPPDGIVGPATATLLDFPHSTLVQNATPLVTPHPVTRQMTPHDDTASLVAFYGNPDSASFRDNLVDVAVPWPLTYEGRPWEHPIKLHRKCAPLFQAAFAEIWKAADGKATSPVLAHVSRFSGAGNDRTVRGSSRKSCHAFYAAIDFDASNLPMGTRVPADVMPKVVVDAFEDSGLYWGGRFVGRADPMHIQAAHE